MPTRLHREGAFRAEGREVGITDPRVAEVPTQALAHVDSRLVTAGVGSSTAEPAVFDVAWSLADKDTWCPDEEMPSLEECQMHPDTWYDAACIVVIRDAEVDHPDLHEHGVGWLLPLHLLILWFLSESPG